MEEKMANAQGTPAGSNLEGQATAQPQAESFTSSVDPSKLAPELQQIYKSMQADYTRKTQQLAEERKRYEKELNELRNTLRYYEQILPYMTQSHQVQEQPQTQTTEGQTVRWDPLDEAAVKAYFGQYLQEAAKQYTDQIRNWLQWHWYVTSEAIRLSKIYPEFNVYDVVRHAPMYGYNLEMTAKALYESPKVWDRSKKAEELEKELQALRQEVEQLRKRAAAGQPYVVGPGPAKPLKLPNSDARTLQDIAASIPLEQVLLKE